MMCGYDFDVYVHSIACRQPRRLPACLSVCTLARELHAINDHCFQAPCLCLWVCLSVGQTVDSRQLLLAAVARAESADLHR